jgi:transposase
MATVHLTDRQWVWIQPLLPPPARTGRPRATDATDDAQVSQPAGHHQQDYAELHARSAFSFLKQRTLFRKVDKSATPKARKPRAADGRPPLRAVPHSRPDAADQVLAAYRPGMRDKQLAAAAGVSVPTARKHRPRYDAGAA